MSRIVCLAVAAAVTTLSLGFSGCCHTGGGCGGGGIGGFIDGFMEKQVGCMRDHVWAKRAFHLRYGHCERIHADHFQDGFLSGYGNICQGHTGECPPLPPQKYWSYKYRNQDGSQMQEAWFAGFEAGSSSAKSDGASTYQEIQISRDLEEAMMTAEAIENLHGGLQSERIVEGSIVTLPNSASASQMNSQANMPYMTNGSYGVQGNQIINNNTPFAQPPMPMPVGSPLPMRRTMPMTNTSNSAYGNSPMPLKIVPAEVPIIPGNQR